MAADASPPALAPSSPLPTVPRPAEASLEGLTSAEARQRLRSYGPNILVPTTDARWWSPIPRAVADPMVLLLVLAVSAYLVLGERGDAVVLGAAVVPIVAMNLALELRAERTLAKLRALTAPRVSVWRDGRWQDTAVETLVPGHCFALREGDIVPADGEVVEAAALRVDEAALTGESLPLTKGPPAPGGDVTATRLLAGSTVLSGRGVARVRATGVRTEYGRIGALVAATPTQDTPLQRSIRRLVRGFGLAAAIICLVVVALELARGTVWPAALLSGVSLAMAAIPEEFPIVFTLYLSLGVWRMARHQALIRRLAGVEVLGSTTVICTDKTGTLTEGRMAVAAIEPAARRDEVLLAAALASDPRPDDPLDRAVRAALPKDEVATGGWQLVHAYGFDQRERLAAYVWRDDRGTRWLFAKGAFEAIAARAGTPAGDEALHAWNEAMTGRGQRVLAVARRRLATFSGGWSSDVAGLEMLGLVGFADPLRPEVPAALAECAAAGVKVVMLTGDHPLTAQAIAASSGLGEAAKVVGGDALERADERQLGELTATSRVFARVLPAQKHRLVCAYQGLGEVVAMTGDGVNDAPALRAADVGVAMGRRGTEVARAAASVVLLDDNFATIVAAIREGRRIFTDLRRAFVYLVAFHVPIVLAALLIPMLGAPLLLLPIHLIWLELIVHPTAALLFQADAPDPQLMRRPPHRPSEGLLPRGAALRSVVEGLLVTSNGSSVALAFAGVSKRYRTGTLALDNVTWSVAVGARACLLGPNGAGKSTAIRLLQGALAPTSGRVTLLDADVGGDAYLAARRRTGIVPQGPGMYTDLTVAEYLRLARQLYGRGDAGRLVQLLDLAPHRHRLLSQLSGGYQRRVVLAAALLAGPDLLLLDEPTAGLDPVAAHDVHAFLREELRREGRTTLLCTHNLAEAEALCEDVIILRAGRVRVQAPLADLRARAQPQLRLAARQGAEVLLAALTARGLPGRVQDDGSVELSLPDPAAVAPSLLRGLLADGLDIYVCQPVQASLEDLFLDLIRAERSAP